MNFHLRGPDDDGKTVDGPGNLAKRAFINGIQNGRRGKVGQPARVQKYLQLRFKL